MKRKLYTSFDDGRIVESFLGGKKPKTIAGFPIRTVYSKYKKFLERGHLDPLPRSGRPTKLTLRDKTMICRISTKDPFLSAPDIQEEIGRNDISTRTISRVLVDHGGLNACKAAKKLLLSEKNRIARLDFARRYQNWTIDQWKQVLWSDESKFLLRKQGSRVVRRPVGTRYSDEYTIKTIKHDDYVMIWGCFTWNGVGKLHQIKGIMDSEMYRQVLIHQMIPSSRDLFGRNNFIFQHDNDPKHTSGIVKRYIENKGLNLLPWPAQSPDLNPIENLWSELDSRLSKRTCNTETQLMTVLQEGWANLDHNYLQKLVESMPRRCKAVIKARGRATKY